MQSVPVFILTHYVCVCVCLYVWIYTFSFIQWPCSYCLHVLLLSQKSEEPSDYDKHDPEQKQIYRFVRTLFSAAQLTAECAIVTLVKEGDWLSPLFASQMAPDPIPYIAHYFWPGSLPMGHLFHQRCHKLDLYIFWKVNSQLIWHLLRQGRQNSPPRYSLSPLATAFYVWSTGVLLVTACLSILGQTRAWSVPVSGWSSCQSVCQRLLTSLWLLPKCHPFPYLVHFFWPRPI
jgi:hypothetical protein